MFTGPEELQQSLEKVNYLADKPLATAVFLSSTLQKPLLVEGPAGVGKTQLAIALAAVYKRKLVRLQCYEGIDASKALYDWNYHRQLLRIQAGQGEDWQKASSDVFSKEFILARPLLQAIMSAEPTLLLIDELDKSSEEFESFLLELLAEFQVTIPELGTIRALHKPMVLLTSNGCRDFGDALRRRCLHLYITYPDYTRETDIVLRHCPEINPLLVREGVKFVHQVRNLKLRKAPSVAESVDFLRAMHTVGASEFNAEDAGTSLGALLKYTQDVQAVREKVLENPVRHE